MREIKFRAKDTLERNWYIGSYMFTNDNTNNPFRSEPFKESHRIIFYSSCDWNMGGWNDVEIDPSTLGQYTGLQDKNGKEIYEGDIVLTPFVDPIFGDMVGEDLCVKRQVKFNDGSFVVNEGDGFIYLECFTRNNHIEICGNIHDNQELLTK